MKEQNEPPAVVTLSARFDAAETLILRQAADLRQWSLSQLVRAGAYEKAVNIVNARGDGALAVRLILADVVRQFFYPTVWVTPFGQSVERRYGDDDQDGDSVRVEPLDDVSIKQFIDAIRKLGPELADMLLDEVKRACVPATTAKLIDPFPRVPTSLGSMSANSPGESSRPPAKSPPRQKRTTKPNQKKEA
ncbi:MAG: hypothetical protein HZB38_11770 [Planctomycetes bacterium]|nr:hypothetical protein [Planctomycetota bacterium]